MTQIYSLNTNFPNGLINHKLKNDINNNITITNNNTNNCININTIDDIVNIEFNNNLVAAEQLELNNLISAYTYVNEDDIDNSYIMVSFDFDNVNSNNTYSTNHIMVNSGSSYVGNFDTTTGIYTINEKGLYVFSLFYDNKTVLNNTDFHKIIMEEITGSGAKYSRNVVSRSEAIGDLDQIISATMVIPANHQYKFFMKRILGAGIESYNTILQISRLK